METRLSTKCLICGQKKCKGDPLRNNDPESSLISKHLQVIFLLRNILEVPISKLIIFLKSHPKLESWLSICDKCTEMVNNCKSTYEAVLEAQRKFRTVKQEIIKVLKESALIKEEISQEDLYEYHDKAIDIVEQIRGFVYQNNYPKNTDPFISGDRLAYQQLSHKLDTVLQQLEEEEDDDIDNQSWCGANDDDLPGNQDDDWIPSDDEQPEIDKKHKNKRSRPRPPPPSSSSRSTGTFNLTRRQQKPLSATSKMRKYKRGKFTCPHCSKPFPYQIYLNKHIKKIHDQNLSATCSTCGSLFSDNGALLKHTPKCTGISIPCPQPNCPRKFHTDKGLTIHLRDTHGSSISEDPRRKCKFCGKQFPKFYMLERHIRAIHEQTDDNFKCDICGVSRRSNTDLNLHRKTCDGTSIPCPDSNCQLKFSTFILLNKHVITTHQDNVDNLLPFKCNHCENKAFLSAEQLRNHNRKNHPGANPKVEHKPESLICPVAECQQQLASASAYKRHLNYFHDPKKLEESRNKRTCKICDKTFAKWNLLKKHINAVHERNESLICDICGIGRISKASLEQHRKVCKGESLSCPAPGCEMKCSGSISLNYHVFASHKDNVEDLLPFKCAECVDDDKRFLNVVKLKNHILFKHRKKKGSGRAKAMGPFICETCGGTYASRDSLTRHRRLNLSCKKLRGEEEEKGPVICDVCGGSFKSKACLKMHVKVVHEKRFTMTCEICGQGKNGKARMEIHMWQKHKVGDERKWRCGVDGCTVKIYGKRDREDHMRKHRGEEPRYKCEECGKGFYMWSNIRQHEKEVHQGRRCKRGNRGRVKEEQIEIEEEEDDAGSNYS